MKDVTPAWSAVVVVPKGRNVLILNRGFVPRDPALPGGDSEPQDKTPAETARRELYEESGLVALEVKCIDEWTGERGQPVYVFLVLRWKGRVRSSSEGKPFFGAPARLLLPTAKYHQDAARVLERVAAEAA